MIRKYFSKAIAVVLFTIISITANSAITPPSATDVIPVKTENPRVAQIQTRLLEIKGMDKSALTGSEKTALRREVKSLKKEMKKSGNGVYISVGAAIIIILLLILIL